ncbi:hypothetical protein RJ639_041713 [Escallonia herrerae]|uniref:Retrovirus-related Pol polyprotein from transposon TNT 1-94 n=1 Tax=Escallonia herrerae TaxID=1293975 RepID=A0AA89B4P0_9ASTE|nr:hypothetical protein RJ639_041713 [Escallonia herrerae]
MNIRLYPNIVVIRSKHLPLLLRFPATKKEGKKTAQGKVGKVPSYNPIKLRRRVEVNGRLKAPSYGAKYLDEGSIVAGAAARASSSHIDSNTNKLWHMHLGHMSERSVDVLTKQGLLGSKKIGKLNFYEHCVFGKQCRKIEFIDARKDHSVREKVELEVRAPKLLPIISTDEEDGFHCNDENEEPQDNNIVLPEIDQEEKFNLLRIKHTSIRMFLAMVALYDLELEQLDVKTAFLHGELEVQIFMRQPKGFVIQDKEDHMLVDGSHIYLLVYVDDMLIAEKSMLDINGLKEQLKREFEMKDLGVGKRILGMEIQRDRHAGKCSDWILFGQNSARPLSLSLGRVSGRDSVGTEFCSTVVTLLGQSVRTEFCSAVVTLLGQSVRKGFCSDRILFGHDHSVRAECSDTIMLGQDSVPPRSLCWGRVFGHDPARIGFCSATVTLFGQSVRTRSCSGRILFGHGHYVRAECSDTILLGQDSVGPRSLCLGTILLGRDFVRPRSLCTCRVFGHDSVRTGFCSATVTLFGQSVRTRSCSGKILFGHYLCSLQLSPSPLMSLRGN